MNSIEVLAMYEHIAGLTNQMVLAANSGNWPGLASLERQCAVAARPVSDGAVAASSGIARTHKIEFLKQILANDRTIRDRTEPWMTRLPGMMQAPRREQ